MRERLKFLGVYGLFWLVFHFTIRAAFMLYNYDLSSQLTLNEIFLVFWNGLRMDLSITGYCLALAGLLLTFSVFFTGSWFATVIQSFSLLFLFVTTFMTVVDFELYRHWGFRLNTTPLFYLGPEAMGSVQVGVVIKLVTIWILLFSVWAYLYLRLVAPSYKNFKPAFKQSGFTLLVVSSLMVIPIRGSFTVAPMNTGFVYFHKTKAFANHAAINVVWNFLYSVQKGARTEYPENFLDKKIAQKYFAELHPVNDSTTLLFNTRRPNIILFILESFTADVIEPLGGLKGVAPNLSKLCSEGILFDNFYSSGDRTDKGLISLLSAYPAQPVTSIIKYPEKSRHLPYLGHELKKLGYTTSFLYGGDIDFANFRSYLTTSGFDNITTEEDFDDDINISKWGVHDHYLLDRASHECDTATQPFFKVILTLSSHEPFDVPMTPVFKGHDEETLFLNACYYTDKSIGDFIRKAKAQKWWKNSLVIFVADHGHRHPHHKELKDKERFHIPLLMIGGAVPKDTVIHTYGGHTDLANTLLAQLDKPHPEFIFSRDLLGNNTVSFAPYFFNDGFGFVAPGKYFVHDNPGNQFLRKDGAVKNDLARAKAYQQILFSDYNSR